MMVNMIVMTGEEGVSIERERGVVGARRRLARSCYCDREGQFFFQTQLDRFVRHLHPAKRLIRMLCLLF